RYSDRLAKWSAVERAYWESIRRKAQKVPRRMVVLWEPPGEHFGPPHTPDNLVECLARCAPGEDNPARQAKNREEQALILRDIFGRRPLRPVTINPAWRTSNVTALAQSIYDDRAFDRLPILADALEDAGCDNADVLNHCRQPGEHVRGCWVLDLILDKG